MTRARALALLIVASLVVTPLVATAASAEAQRTAVETDGVSAPLASLSAAENNTTSTTANNSTAPATTSAPGSPESAETVRILPVQLEADFVTIETAEQGEQYNTTGPFAFFTLSEPVETVAIQQPKAEATVLEGGRAVRVQYDSDAAAVGKSSLYELELYFADGSSRTVQLYASKTSVSTGAAELKQYRPFIMDALNDAESAGYERDAEGVEKH